MPPTVFLPLPRGRVTPTHESSAGVHHVLRSGSSHPLGYPVLDLQWTDLLGHVAIEWVAGDDEQYGEGVDLRYENTMHTGLNYVGYMLYLPAGK